MVHDEPSDEALLERHLAGDRRAFDRLVRRHEDRIFALALKMTGQRADALDATQEAFVAAFNRARSFRGESAFGTWLYRIAINACTDLLRRRARNPVAGGDESAEQPEPGRQGVDDLVGLRLDLERALAALTPEYREAVCLFDLGGVPYEEIARVTGVSLGTVKSRISRGRRRLAELLQEHPGPPATSKDRL